MTKTNEGERAVELNTQARDFAWRVRKVGYPLLNETDRLEFDQVFNLGYEAGTRATRWHRVADGLPKSDGCYNVAFDDGKSTALFFDVDDGTWNAGGDGWPNDIQGVIAWQVIEPYIEEEQNAKL